MASVGRRPSRQLKPNIWNDGVRKQKAFVALKVIGSVLTVVAVIGCGADDGTRRISSSVMASLACYPNVSHWYNALTYKEQFGQYPSDDNDSGYSLFPGDRVQILETHEVDEQPGLERVTGGVDRVKILSGDNPGATCWLFDGSNSNGPLYE